MTSSDSENRKQIYEMKQKNVFFDAKPCRLILLRDIQEVSRIEYARSLEKITEIMIATTSHDMRTPLNTIINMLRLI
jgi:signal transduction histidine kinase